MGDVINGVASEYELPREPKFYPYDSKLPRTNCNIPMPNVKPVVSVMPESKLSLSCPKVFMFKTDLPIEGAMQAQQILKDQIQEGCLVIPDCMEFIGIEEPLVVLS